MLEKKCVLLQDKEETPGCHVGYLFAVPLKKSTDNTHLFFLTPNV